MKEVAVVILICFYQKESHFLSSEFESALL